MASQLVFSSEEKPFLYILIAFLYLFGISGNGTFLLTVYRIQRMRSVTNAYLCNVAIADLLFLTYSAVITSYTLSVSSWKNGLAVTTSFGCILSFSFVSFPYYLSLTLITFVSLDRFYAICLPFSHRVVSSKSHTKRVIALAWAMTIILSIAFIPTLSRVTFQCIIWPNDQKIFQNFPTRSFYCDIINDSALLIIYCIFVTIVNFVV